MPHKTSRITFHRRIRACLAVGCALTILGFLILALSAVVGDVPLWWNVNSLGRLGITIGVVTTAVSLLSLKGRSIEEAYTLGYDLGYEKGSRAGQRDLLSACPHQSCVLRESGLYDDPESVAAAVEAARRERKG